MNKQKNCIYATGCVQKVILGAAGKVTWEGKEILSCKAIKPGSILDLS